MLAELAAMTLTLARDLQNRALEAESVQDATRLATAFQQVSRGLRQTLALELKVIRFREELAQDAPDAEECAAVERFLTETHVEAIRRRRDRLRDEAGRAIWSEAEDLSSDEFPEGFEPPAEPERMSEALEVWLDAAMQRPDFLRSDFDLLVIEACEAIGADPRRLYDICEPGRLAPSTDTS